MKQIIYIIMLLMFLGLTTAYSDGQIVTQQAINKLNVSTVTWQDFKPNIISHGVYKALWGEFRYLKTEIAILDIIKNNTNYKITNVTFSVNTPLQKVINTINEHNKTYAIDQYNKRIKKYTLNYIERIKLKVENYKNPIDTISIEDIVLLES